MPQLVWNMALPFGTWKGHMMGVETYDEADGLYIVNYFDRTYKASGNTMVIDYEHASLYSFEAPAAGWIHELKVYTQYDPVLGNEAEFEPGVYMLNEWTDRARGMIEAGEYKYLSPVTVRNYPDPVSGENVMIQLVNMALTNMPFMLDKMTTVQYRQGLLEQFGREVKDDLKFTIFSINKGVSGMEFRDTLIQQLGLPADASDQDIITAITGLQENSSLTGVVGIVGETPDERANSARSIAGRIRLFSDTLTMLECTEGEALVRVQTLKNGVDTTAYVPRSEYDTITAELRDIKANSLIAEYADRIPAQKDREMWANRAKDDYEGTKASLASLPKIISGKPVETPVDPPTPGQNQLTEQQALVARKLMLDEAVYSQHLTNNN